MPTSNERKMLSSNEALKELSDTIRQKSTFLFWLLDMLRTYQHVHGPELRKFLKFCIAHYHLSEKYGRYLISDMPV